MEKTFSQARKQYITIWTENLKECCINSKHYIECLNDYAKRKLN